MLPKNTNGIEKCLRLFGAVWICFAFLSETFKSILFYFFDSFQESLTSNNYEKFVSLITGEVTSQLEKAVIKCTFNRVSIKVAAQFMSLYVGNSNKDQ